MTDFRIFHDKMLFSLFEKSKNLFSLILHFILTLVSQLQNYFTNSKHFFPFCLVGFLTAATAFLNKPRLAYRKIT